MLKHLVTQWGAGPRPTVPGILWIGVLLGGMAWLGNRHGGVFLVPPFAATMSILLYLPAVSIAQPYAVVVGSTLGATIGTVIALVLGGGPDVALGAALVALAALPLLRAYHPPGVALAMYPALLHPGFWFPVQVVLPFSLAAVISAAIMSRTVAHWPRYPAPLTPGCRDA
jgi:CBS domain-containing membrane protein